MHKSLIWTARVLAILLIAFFSIFALDVFGRTAVVPWPGDAPDPSFILIALTVLAWKNERLGGFLFLLAALGYGAFLRIVHYSLSQPW